MIYFHLICDYPGNKIGHLKSDFEVVLHQQTKQSQNGSEGAILEIAVEVSRKA